MIAVVLFIVGVAASYHFEGKPRVWGFLSLFLSYVCGILWAFKIPAPKYSVFLIQDDRTTKGQHGTHY